MGFSSQERINQNSKVLAASVNDANEVAQWYESRFPNEFVSDARKIWTQADIVKQYPASNVTAARTNVSGGLAGIIQDYSQFGNAIRLTPVPGANGSTYVAFQTYNDTTSPRMDNWLQPQFVPDGTGAPSNGYAVRLFNGNPAAGGTEVLTTDGTTGAGSSKTVGWIWNYGMGMLFLSSDFRATVTDPWVLGFRYIGSTAAGLSFGRSGVMNFATGTLKSELTYSPTANFTAIQGLSASLTSSGGPVLLLANVDINYASNATNRVATTLFRSSTFGGAVNLGDPTWGLMYFDNTAKDGHNNGSVMFVDYPTSGSYLYYVAFKSPDGTINISKSGSWSQISAIELKMTGSGGADSNSPFILTQLTAALPGARRMFATGGLKSSDEGAGGRFMVMADDNFVPFLSGATFSGVTKFSAGLSGSLTQLPDGRSYLAAGNGVTISSSSNGQIVISSYGGGSGGSGDANASFVLTALTTSLPNARRIKAGTNISITDGGAGGDLTIASTATPVPYNYAYGVGSRAPAITQTPASYNILPSLTATLYHSSSVPVLIGMNLEVSSSGEGATTITIFRSSSAGALQDLSFLGNGFLSVGGGLSNVSFTRVDTPPTGAIAYFASVSTAATTVIVQQSSQIFAVEVPATASFGTTTSGGGGGSGDPNAQYIVLSNTGSLTAERALNVGAGLTLTDNGPNSNIVLALSSTGVPAGYYGFPSLLINAQGQILSATIGAAPADLYASYIVVGNTSSLPNERALAVTAGELTAQDNGANANFKIGLADTAVTPGTYTSPTLTVDQKGRITSVSAGTVSYADVAAAYITVGNTSSLPNERAINAGTAIRIVDGGANGLITISVDTNRVATTSGTVFTGPVYFSTSASFSMGVSGSLTQLTDGRSYLVGGPGIAVNSSSNGQVVITATGGGGGSGADVQATYILVTPTSSLPNYRTISGSSGEISITDGGATSNITIGMIATGVDPGQYTAPTIIVDTKGRITKATPGVPIPDYFASYIVVGNTGSLPNERALSGSNSISVVDAGPNLGVTLSANDNFVAMVSGTTFSGVTKHTAGLSGSLTQLADGRSYIVAGTGIAVVSASNGQIVLTAIGGGAGSGADSAAQYVLVNATASLPGERALSGSFDQIRIVDNGAGSTVEVGLTLTGTAGTFLRADVQIDKYGRVTFARNGAPAADTDTSYLVLANTSSLNNERALSMSLGLISSDNGPNSTYVLRIDDNQVPFLTGATYRGSVTVTSPNQIYGRLNFLADGVTPLIIPQGTNASSGITIFTASNGQIKIGFNSSRVAADVNAPFIVASSTGSLLNQRVLAAGAGVQLTDGGSNGSTMLVALTNTGATAGSYSNPILTVDAQGRITAITSTGGGSAAGWTDGGFKLKATSSVSIDAGNNYANTYGTDLFLWVSGSIGGKQQASGVAGFGGDVVISGSLYFPSGRGITGSLTQLPNGTSFLVGGTNISITSQSNGQIVIANTNLATGDAGASYLVLNATASLSNERVLSVSGTSGLILTDSGASGNATLVINNNVVATVSGTRFTGPVSSLGGISGSHWYLADGITSAFVAGPNVQITSQSNGQLLIQASTGGGGSTGNSGWTDGGYKLRTTSSVAIDAGGNFAAAYGTDNFFYVSGSVGGKQFLSGVATFGGDTFTSGSAYAALGFSGSLTKLTDGRSFIVAGANMTVTSQSNGQIVLASSAGSTGFSSAKLLSLPILAGIQSTAYITSSKQSVGALYFNPSVYGAGGNTYFRAILETTNVAALAYIDLYDVNGIVQWPPGVIQASIMSCSSLTPTHIESNLTSVLSVVTGAGLFEARIWLHPSSSGQQVTCKGARIEVQFP